MVKEMIQAALAGIFVMIGLVVGTILMFLWLGWWLLGLAALAGYFVGNKFYKEKVKADFKVLLEASHAQKH